ELENSLREEVDRYINSRLNGLQEEITRLQSQVNEAFTRLIESSRGHEETNTEISASIAEVIRAAHERGIEEAAAESTHTKVSSDMAILKAAIEEISEQHSQAEILNTLVNRAASFAPRVAFFVVKRDQIIGWRARGLEGTVGDDAVREITLPVSADTPLSDVINSRTTWSGQPGGNAEDYRLLSKFGSEPPQRMVAIPLIARGKAAAVLYADSAKLDSDAINLEALETLVRVASMAVELTAVARPQVAAAQQPAQAAPEVAEPSRAAEEEAPQPQPEEEAAQPQAAAQPAEAHEEEKAREFETPSFAVEQQRAEGKSEAAPSYEPQYAATGEDTLVTEAPPETPSETASAQEAEPAAQPQAATETVAQPEQPTTSTQGQFASPLGGARRYGRAADAVELPVEVHSDDERRLHNDARRFARLLVSEIKLYNKDKVEAGRQEGDIYERLREDIDRSRQMYDRRVAPPVAARYDYFHQELVNTLAEGDPSKLGADYPGAAV
ncbi:MAG TPA: GAF domain-containing protein, partial [Pyrinomonadaceae bacterium]|nr:GAF domain-containing protein [Pyrinomonadaceae bacterium]